MSNSSKEATCREAESCLVQCLDTRALLRYILSSHPQQLRTICRGGHQSIRKANKTMSGAADRNRTDNVVVVGSWFRPPNKFVSPSSETSSSHSLMTSSHPSLWDPGGPLEFVAQISDLFLPLGFFGRLWPIWMHTYRVNGISL